MVKRNSDEYQLNQLRGDLQALKTEIENQNNVIRKQILAIKHMEYTLQNYANLKRAYDKISYALSILGVQSSENTFEILTVMTRICSEVNTNILIFKKIHKIFLTIKN